MKRIITCVAIVFAVCSVSSLYAQQDPAARAQRAAEMKQKLKDDLKLTDVQSDSVSAISAEFQPKMREIFQDQAASADDKKAKMDVLNAARNKRIQAVLGDDLFKKYQDWMEKNRPQRRGGGGGGNQ